MSTFQTLKWHTNCARCSSPEPAPPKTTLTSDPWHATIRLSLEETSQRLHSFCLNGRSPSGASADTAHDPPHPDTHTWIIPISQQKAFCGEKTQSAEAQYLLKLKDWICKMSHLIQCCSSENTITGTLGVSFKFKVLYRMIKHTHRYIHIRTGNTLLNVPLFSHL